MWQSTAFGAESPGCRDQQGNIMGCTFPPSDQAQQTCFSERVHLPQDSILNAKRSRTSQGTVPIGLLLHFPCWHTQRQWHLCPSSGEHTQFRAVGGSESSRPLLQAWTLSEPRGLHLAGDSPLLYHSPQWAMLKGHKMSPKSNEGGFWKKIQPVECYSHQWISPLMRVINLIAK